MQELSQKPGNFQTTRLAWRRRSCISHPRRWLFFLAGFTALLPGRAGAQEALRQSLAGAAAAEAQNRAAATIGYYNLLIGDMAWRFSSSLGLQYNDNIRLSENHPEGDEIITPALNASIHYPITLHNSLDLTIGAGYSKYVNHSDLDQFFLTPGTGLFYNVYVGDVVFNLHDRVSITENGYQNPTANGNGNNATLQNTAGVSATWDLESVVLSTGYDHGNYVNLNSNPGTQDSASENIFLNAGVRVRPELLAGVEAGASAVHYSQPNGTYQSLPDTHQWSAGAFTQYKATDHIDAELHVGYTELLPQNSSTNFSTSASQGVYFGASIAHRVNEWLDYTLSADRSQNLQSSGAPYTIYSVRWSPNWRFIQKFSLSTPVWWQHGKQFYYYGGNDYTYDQYGAGINLGRQLTQKLSGSLGYQYVQETSDQRGLNYTVNTISLNFNYQF